MATGTNSTDLSPSSGGSNLAEREFVPEYDDSAGSDDVSRHVGDGRPGIKRRRPEFEVVVDGGALPSPWPSYNRASDGTIAAVDVDAFVALPLLESLIFPCPVCGREFTSKKGLRIHKSVHNRHGSRRGTPSISGGSAVGRRSVSPRSEGMVDSMAMVVPEPVRDPMPIPFWSRSSSAEPNSRSDDSTAILVASADNPTRQVVVHPPCSTQLLQGHRPAAPRVVVAQAQPTVAQGHQVGEAGTPQFFVHQPAGPQVVANHVQHILPPPPARDEQGWWVGKEKDCDQPRFATHQGLGGPMSGHKRQNNEAAAAGLHLGVGEPACANADGTVPGPAMEVASAQPAVPPSVPGVLRLFGVNMVVTPPGAAANGASSVVTVRDQNPAASTSIEQ